ncbi:DNA damage-induced apoptosis suppressor protein [Cricetulus griseus]|uniref:DNA damage-induced apoptosis suppressor protein n=1 Tax=Cricetulus griseus TaxID=10029 RepID=A0A9J7JHF5_CRIGR|nr:DNA damage-induced apoptosis suppressor protein [Cricetulus griseus]XP_027263460.1 DNA damage-induced apoptosis suppressor protein [Cricetulus griseus]XP_027263461.1 DNA damage-induced apoptosis suppressor protein [Cricetulus griseus]XP_027263462.1 DNA damage-induced apoptosis suppressor protein [Cricetulus griseus]
MNRRRKFLLASVLALQNSSFIYPSCQRCFSRIVLDSKRFTCPKCGSTGEAESSSYRYRLSLKVAESSKLYVITVFGSCLDTFFGLTATGLKRHLENSSEIPEPLDSGRMQSLLTTAVENCFVGQSFVFGVTNFGDICGHDSDSNNFLQPCCKCKGEVRTLIASQIVLPDPHITGFTVIDYLNQLLHTSNFKKHHCDSQEYSSHSLTLDHSDSDLGSLHGSVQTSCFLESCSRDDLLRFWQPSLELTSTDSQVTANDDFSASEQTLISGTPDQNKQCVSFSEATCSKNCQDPFQSSQSLVSCMDKNNTTGKQGREFGLQANHLSPICPSFHESRLSDSNLFPSQMQECFQEDNAECYSEAEIKNEYSQYDIPCYQHRDINTTTILQERPAFSLSSLKPEETSASQNCDSLIWDDLPFSESLSKFLAVVESEIAVTKTDTKDRKQVTDNDVDKFHTDHSRLSVTPRKNTGTLNTLPLRLRSSQAMVKENSRKETFSNCESNISPQIQRESKPDKTAEAVSIGSDSSGISECFLLDTCLSALFTSSKDMDASVPHKRTAGILQQRDVISLRSSTSTNNCSYLSNKSFNGCREKSHSETKGKLTSLCSKKYSNVSDIHKLENKQYYRWSKNQDDNFTICRKLTYPLETLCHSPNNTNTAKELPHRPINNNLTQSYSADHEGSYNASADLFDDVAKNKDIGTEITKIPQDILLPWEASCTENHPIDEEGSQPSQKLPLQNIATSRYLRASSQSDSECDFEESQDFVPCSQSTPVAGFHQRIHGLHRPFKILPSLYSNLNANYKNTKLSPENGKHQATSTCPKNVKTPSQKSRSPDIPSLTKPEISNPCSTAECLESDVDEWFPPTTQKVFLSDILGFQVTRLRKCLAVYPSPDQKELPRKKPNKSCT